MDRQKEFVLRTLEERDIRFVRLWFTDVLGYLKSVAIAPAELEGAFEEGIGFDGSAIEGFARVSEADMVARPDPSTFQVQGDNVPLPLWQFVQQFLNQFEQVRTIMRQMAKMSIFERIKMVTGLSKMGAMMPGGLKLKKGDTGHRKSAKERAEERKKKRKQGRRK